ncbi:hypothetical protein [Nocardia blacklockiae]|uniref:hypothetical protein n=1 Tax=Nocardia blacklockiae TaxID=480036 RepID=UPI001894CD9C|nr:hypothetical protein [Nocardia blacklockiae]MBF6171313.1 hypothetical protein [Nocardia blacklockiae]
MSPLRRPTRVVRRYGTAIAALALLGGTGLIAVAGHNTPPAEARPLNPYVPCDQWQEMHPGWPCWGNFPEIEEPTLPSPPPGQPTPQATVPTPTGPPTTTSVQPPAAALTPPPPRPAPDPCKAIIPVPGYIPPALPGHPENAPCSQGEPTQPPRNPRELIEPYIHPACGIPGLRVLSPEEVHEVVIGIIGPLEIENPNDPFVRRVIDRTNELNKGCFGNKSQIQQQVWNELRNEWYRIYRDRNINRDRTKKRCDMKDTSKDCEGVVAVCLPKKDQGNRTPIQENNLQEQRNEYIEAANEIIHTNGTPLVRQELDEVTQRLADRARDRQRDNNRPTYYPPQIDTDRYPSGAIDAGHLPDTVWTGVPDPPPRYWMPMDMSLNRSIGTQAKRYPVNYKARAFVPGVWLDSACVPRPDPYGLAGIPPSITPS